MAITSPVGYEAESLFSSMSEEERAANEAAEDARRRYEEQRQRLWDPAWAAAQRQTEAARQYGLEAQQMTTAAQQQLGAGIGQTRADMMAAAGARGLSPALGRAAGYAGGGLQQRGVGQARALQAQELAAAQAQYQQALAAQAGLTMGMGEQLLGQSAAEQQAYQSMQALQASQAAQAAQQAGQYAAAGIGAGGAFASQIGGGWGGGQQQGWSPEYQQQYQQWAEAYSDRALKTDVRRPSNAEQRRLLSALSGAGRQYQYTPDAQQRLGQPAGEQYGPMAQDLAKTQLGASAVRQTPEGLAVDTGRLGLIAAGLLGQQEERLRKLERKGGR
jgi:hypothetical protein